MKKRKEKYKKFYIASIVLLMVSILGLGLTIAGVIFRETYAMQITGLVGLIMAAISFPLSYLMDHLFRKETKDKPNIQK